VGYVRAYHGQLIGRQYTDPIPKTELTPPFPQQQPQNQNSFQQVVVDQPSVEDTIAILRGLKERYEVHHG
jgi:hypothetical protein